jgi:hypothetical protein
VIVEERIYRIRTGQIGRYMDLVRSEGIAIQKPILGHLIGYFQTEIGPLSHVVHLWAYRDFEDRLERRRRLAADPRWQAFIPRLSELIESADNRILIPTDFSPLRSLEDTP